LLLPPRASAQGVPAEAEAIDHPALGDAALFRLERRLFVVPAKMTETGSAVIPRFCGSLREASGLREDDEMSVSVHPEPSRWTLRWRNADENASGVALTFDQQPRLPSELGPVSPAGDGSVMLPAHRAITSGEKLRYEPQPFKNTVGYWTETGDVATWKLRLDRAGPLNVGILQGCGEGQGGSRGTIRLIRGDRVVARLAFETIETGHFQNFRWRHLGEMIVPEPGNYTLEIVPIEIKNAALMDVRAVHLIPVPE
jgi:hypothetical protein